MSTFPRDVRFLVAKKNQIRIRNIRNVEKKKVFSCDQCEVKNMKKVAFVQHLHKIHPGTDIPCQNCDFKSTSSRGLEIHQRNRRRSLQSCKICSFLSCTSRGLSRHYRGIHSDSHMKSNHKNVKKYLCISILC